MADRVLCDKDAVVFCIPDFFEPDLDTDYHKVWENENLILVSKPADLPVHSNRRFYYQTMTAVLRRNESNDELNPLHRLDRETSGLMLFIKKAFSLPAYRRHPEKIIREKFYLAIVHGFFDTEEKIVDIPLKQADCPPVGYQMVADATGMQCRTFFYRLAASSEYSLVLARLDTGRKHQIRAHLACCGFPWSVTKLYGLGGKFFIIRCNDELVDADLQC
jgi:23S rRNA-/tRNA-specific pseudouridylate synthase